MAVMDTPNYRQEGGRVFEGTCPKGETHVYIPGGIICDKCWQNRLREPYHAKDAIKFWGRRS